MGLSHKIWFLLHFSNPILVVFPSLPLSFIFLLLLHTCSKSFNIDIHLQFSCRTIKMDNPRISHFGEFFRCAGLEMNIMSTEASNHKQNWKFKFFGVKWFHYAIAWKMIFLDLLLIFPRNIAKIKLVQKLLGKYTRHSTNGYGSSPLPLLIVKMSLEIGALTIVIYNRHK